MIVSAELVGLFCSDEGVLSPPSDVFLYPLGSSYLSKNFQVIAMKFSKFFDYIMLLSSLSSRKT